MVQQNGAIKLPKSIMTASREEYYGQDASHMPIDLTVRYGAIPEDLHGFVYYDVPVGHVDQGSEVGPGTPVFSGDGLIYQLNFNEPGRAILKTRLANTPSFIADKVTNDAPKKSEYAKLRFSDMGLGRMNIKLGMRNDLNTAFLPFKGADDEQLRMLVTCDDGRPFEIDPATLETVTPIGYNKEWRPLMGEGVKIFGVPFGVMPFQLFMGTAHPVYDPTTSETFSANYGRPSVSPLTAATTFIPDCDTLPELLWLLIKQLPKLLMYFFMVLPVTIFSWIRKRIGNYTGATFTYLLRWMGDGELERWNVVTPDGRPVEMQQTLHQMAITEDYIILLDAAFKFSVTQMVSHFSPFNMNWHWLERRARRLMTGPQLPNAYLYIIDRRQLETTAGQRSSQPSATHNNPPSITAQKVILPPEALHFLAEYDNPDGVLTLHLAHNSAACFAEWIREYDTLAYQPHGPVDPAFLGMIAIGQVDISRIGRYKIDGKSGMVFDSRLVNSLDSPNTFNLGLYTCLDETVFGRPTRSMPNVYWMGGGMYNELLTQFIYDMYKNYRYRAIPLNMFEELTREGKPSNLMRLNTETMEFVDHYTWAGTHVGLTPQFVPKKGNRTDPADGYIVCTVVSDVDGAEFWIFDAQDLSDPVCILGDERIDFGVTIHSSWMPDAPARNAAYHVDLRQDYGKLVNDTRNETIKSLFEQFIYPAYSDDAG